MSTFISLVSKQLLRLKIFLSQNKAGSFLDYFMKVLYSSKVFFRAKDIVLVKGEIITSDAPSVLITDLTGKIMR